PLPVRPHLPAHELLEQHLVRPNRPQIHLTLLHHPPELDPHLRRPIHELIIPDGTLPEIHPAHIPALGPQCVTHHNAHASYVGIDILSLQLPLPELRDEPPHARHRVLVPP
ncbi:MAG: hypothetical protein ACK55I_39150, partial [bacterium]